MRISIKRMPTQQECDTDQLLRVFDSSLEDFFRTHKSIYQDQSAFPVIGFEGGCQYAFDRDEQASVTCLSCLEGQEHKAHRYCVQPYAKLRFCILDLDLNPRVRPDCVSKYQPLTEAEANELQRMEDRLKDAAPCCFFYRTKCNGMRIGFEITDAPEDDAFYKRLTRQHIGEIGNYAPNGRFGDDAMLKVDDCSFNPNMFWVYPRIGREVWLNPQRHNP